MLLIDIWVPKAGNLLLYLFTTCCLHNNNMKKVICPTVLRTFGLYRGSWQIGYFRFIWLCIYVQSKNLTWRLVSLTQRRWSNWNKMQMEWGFLILLYCKLKEVMVFSFWLYCHINSSNMCIIISSIKSLVCMIEACSNKKNASVTIRINNVRSNFRYRILKKTFFRELVWDSLVVWGLLLWWFHATSVQALRGFCSGLLMLCVTVESRTVIHSSVFRLHILSI